MTIEEHIRKVLKEYLELEKDFSLDTPLRELGADSLDEVEIVMQFEDDFGFEVCDEEIEALKTVNDIVELVKRHGKYEITPRT